MSLLLSDAVIHTECGQRNLAQVTGGERELRTTYLRPFNRACVDSLSIMTAYASYDGVPAVANSRKRHRRNIINSLTQCFLQIC